MYVFIMYKYIYINTELFSACLVQKQIFSDLTDCVRTEIDLDPLKKTSYYTAVSNN